jgi:hypothetical protein
VLKRAVKRPSATRPQGSSDAGSALDLGPDLDLSTLIVDIDLEKLVLDLEAGSDGDQPLAHVVEPPADVVEPPARVIEPPAEDIEVPPAERRLAARLSNSEIGDDVQVSLPRATRTVLVNVSETGVLIETNCQLFPGRTTDVFVKLRGERQALRATVVRSFLHSLTSEKVVYRSALHFERIIGLARHLSR